MPDQIQNLKSELAQYERQLSFDNLTPEQRNDISRQISRLKIKIFLDGVRENTDAT